MKVNDKVRLLFFIYHIGNGASANVFLFKPYDQSEEKFQQSNYAIKVFHDRNYYERELAINESISKRFNGCIPDVFTKQAGSIQDKKSIIYERVGQRIQRLDKSRILEIFDAIRELHTRGIIHRDLSPNHFYQVYNKYIFFVEKFYSYVKLDISLTSIS